MIVTDNTDIKILKYDYGKVQIIHSPSNCKLSYLEGIDFLCKDENKSKFDEVLRQSNPVVFLTLNKEVSKDFIIKNYKYYYYNEVPIGYGYNGSDDNQYHILIRNSSSIGGRTKYLRDEVEKENNNVSLFRELYEDIKHGDEEHQKWLKDKIEEFIKLKLK